jgi:hypothetical protein
MRIILNEKKYAENALQNGEVDKYPTTTLRVIIKYLFRKNMSEEQIYGLIDDFIKKHLKDYNDVSRQKKIDDLISQVRNDESNLLEIEQINITEKELDIIRNLNEIKLEKLAFVLLVYSKIYNIKNNNNTYWINSSTRDIFSDCKIAIVKKKQELLIHELINLGLVEISHIVDNTSIKIRFADENSSVGIVITDFRDFVYYYLKWRGEKIGECDECDRLFKANRNIHKYCKDCAKNIEKKNWKHRKRKQRKSEIVTK